MKVLITGSRGYIGSVLFKTLVKSGSDPIGVDIKIRKDGSTWYGLNFTPLNMDDDIVIQQVIDREVDTIFHLAASADVGDSVANPAPFYYNNIGRTSNMMSKLISKGWKGKVIFSSTAAVYQERNEPVDENSVIGSPNPYGKSKYACEQLFNDLYKSHGISAVIFRYFNVAGAWDDVGDHLDANHIISRLCHTIHSNTEFKLFGQNKNTPDGSCIRDYVHVRDVCNAHIHAAKFLDANPGVHIFNLGSGYGRSNLDVIRAFKLFTSHTPKYVVDQGRPGDPDFLVANPDKFCAETSYRYMHSSLESIIVSAWQYYCNKMEK